MPYENLLKKYDLSEAELEKEISAVGHKLGSTVCNVMALLAISDLLLNGDVKEENT